MSFISIFNINKKAIVAYTSNTNNKPQLLDLDYEDIERVIEGLKHSKKEIESELEG